MTRRCVSRPSIAAVFSMMLWLLCDVAHAHKQSDSYLTLTLTGSTVQGQWDIALRDLDLAVGLDADADGELTWGEVRTQRAAIEAYALQRLQVLADDGDAAITCPLRSDVLLIDEHVDGAYAVLKFQGTCTVTPVRLGVDYRLLFPLDPNHHGLLQLRGPSGTQTAILTRDAHSTWLTPLTRNGWQEFRAYLSEGMWHIWAGYDHLLFLFTLLLPAVVVYRDGEWRAERGWRDSVVDILRVVTAFTGAHSLTLVLAALGMIRLSSRWVEAAIAATVLLGALNILRPVVRERRWLVALVFGLVHGLGFAAVLGDLGLPSANLLQALLGFNAGVELGQLAIVAVLMPVIYWIRQTVLYRRVLLPTGASSIAVLALYWFVTRAFPATAIF